MLVILVEGLLRVALEEPSASILLLAAQTRAPAHLVLQRWRLGLEALCVKLTIRWIARLAIPASTSAAPLALACKAAALVSYVVLF